MSNEAAIIPLYTQAEDGSVKVHVPNFLAEREKYSRYTREQKDEILEIAFSVMEAGYSLDLVCTQLNVSAAVILKWICNEPELESRYENQKKVRARLLIEGVLGRIQVAETIQEAKMADMYARHAIKIAALLRPEEFSDRKNERTGVGGGQGVSFTLNFNHADGHNERVRVTAGEHTKE